MGRVNSSSISLSSSDPSSNYLNNKILKKIKHDKSNFKQKYLLVKFEELKDFAPNFSSSCRLYLPERVRSRSPREMDMEAIVGGLFCMVLLFAIFPLIWYKRRRSLRDEDLHRDEEVEPLVTVIVHSFFGVFYIIIPSICENFRPMFSSCCSSI